MDAKGDTIQTYNTKSKKNKLTVEKGGNDFVWNTRYKGAERLPGMILWAANLSGSKAVPGTYKVSLKVNDEETSQTFNIIPDPRAEASVADMQRQFDFVEKVNKTVDKAHQSIKKIRKIKGQLEAFEKQYKGNDELKDLLDKAKDLKEQFTTIEETLYQTKNRSGQDPLNFPIRLTNKLAAVTSLITRGDFPPTDQDIAVANELTGKIDAELVKFDKLVSEEISNFNNAFNDRKLNYLFLED